MENDDIAENVGQHGQSKMQNKAPERRAFQPSQRELEPYRKQHKITVFDYEISEIPRPLNTTQDFPGMISIGCHGRNSYGDRVEFSDNHGSTSSTEGVIHDLAIAKSAMQIQMQVTEYPTYDNIFITFGTFHISMAYFTVLGSLIDWSGGPAVRTDGLFKGKHYNR